MKYYAPASTDVIPKSTFVLEQYMQYVPRAAIYPIQKGLLIDTAGDSGEAIIGVLPAIYTLQHFDLLFVKNGANVPGNIRIDVYRAREGASIATLYGSSPVLTTPPNNDELFSHSLDALIANIDPGDCLITQVSYTVVGTNTDVYADCVKLSYTLT